MRGIPRGSTAWSSDCTSPRAAPGRSTIHWQAPLSKRFPRRRVQTLRVCCNLSGDECAFSSGSIEFRLSPACGAGQWAVAMLIEFELIEKAKNGDESAFNQVVLAYRKRILGTIARLIGRPEDVEDIGQEVFLRLYYSLDQLRAPEVFEPWLYRLTGNAADDYLRRQKRRQESRMPDLGEQQVIMADASAGVKKQGEEVRRTKVREMVQSLLGKVSEEDRILLMLKEVEGLSLEELEQVYKVKENALKVRLFRAV